MPRIYWHRDLPPLADELMGAHTLEAVSDAVEYRWADRDALWTECSASLKAHLTERLEQEIDRLGGSCAHVLEEDITPHVDYPTNRYWLIGRLNYTLYRHPAAS